MDSPSPPGALHGAARHAAPTYAALLDTVRQSPVVAPEETGWQVDAALHWLWVSATPSATVYAIQAGRGFDEAAVLGADFTGVLVRDGSAPYRQFEQAAHQSCVVHLLVRCRELQPDHPRAPLPAQVQALLQHALRLCDRHAAGTVSTHGVAVEWSALFKVMPGDQRRRDSPAEPDASLARDIQAASVAPD